MEYRDPTICRGCFLECLEVEATIVSQEEGLPQQTSFRLLARLLDSTRDPSHAILLRK